MFSGLPCESHIAHIAHIARTRGRVDVEWLALDPHSTYSTYSKDAGDCEGLAAWCLPRLA